MQLAPEHPAERGGVKRDIGDEFIRGEPSLFEPAIPITPWRIVVGQHHTMRRVPNPIHRAQRQMVQLVLAQVVLDDHRLASDAGCFADQDLRIIRVVQNIHEGHHIDAVILHWDRRAIKQRDRNMDCLALHDVDALHLGAILARADHFGDLAITGADIQHV